MLKFARRRWSVAALTIVALVVAAYSLTANWYRTSIPFWDGTSTWVIGLDSIELHPQGGSGPYSDSIMDFMRWVYDFALVWFVLTSGFLVSSLVEGKGRGLISGIGSSVVGLGVVVTFAIGIDGAIRGVYGWDSTWPHGFLGSASMIWEWGPLEGWWTFLIAVIIQSFSLVVRSVFLDRDV